MTIFAPFSARFLCIGYGARDPQARLEKQIRKRVVGRGKQRVPPLCIEKQNQKTVVGRGLKGSPTPCFVGFAGYCHWVSAPAAGPLMRDTKAKPNKARWPWAQRVPPLMRSMGHRTHISRLYATQKGATRTFSCTSSDKLAKTNLPLGIVGSIGPNGDHTKPYLGAKYGFV